MCVCTYFKLIHNANGGKYCQFLTLVVTSLIPIDYASMPSQISLLRFYGEWTIVCYLMPNSVYTYISNAWFVNTFSRYTQLNYQTVLFQAIQFSISHLFSLSLIVKQFYLTKEWDSIRCYHCVSRWTWERWQWRVIPHSLKLLHYWSLTFRLLSVIIRTLTGRYYPYAEMQSVFSTEPADWLSRIISTFVLSTILSTPFSLCNKSHTHTHIYIYIYIYVYIYIYTHTHTHTHIYIYIPASSVQRV